MRPLSWFLILLAFVYGLNQYLSVRQANNAIQHTSIIHAYHFVVQLERQNEVDSILGLSDQRLKVPPTAEELAGTAIRRLSYGQGGAIRLELDARSGVDGGVIVYLPLMENGQVARWTCVTPDYPDIASFLPACRYMEQVTKDPESDL